LWDATAGLGIVLLTFLAAAHFGGALAGFVAALALATVPLFLFDHICRSNVYDSFLVLFVSGAALHHALGSQSRRAAMLTGFFAGLALLSKGVAALPLFVILAAFEVSRSGLGGLGSSRLWIAIAFTSQASGMRPPCACSQGSLEEIRFEVPAGGS
jgi:4-amino-4-deoxy-L-arabinose transferase-like glycosyltransferase